MADFRFRYEIRRGGGERFTGDNIAYVSLVCISARYPISSHRVEAGVVYHFNSETPLQEDDRQALNKDGFEINEKIMEA